jgi:hypothetical protein
VHIQDSIHAAISGPAGAGQAFFYVRDGCQVLVDGGWRGGSLANSLSSYLPDVRRIDIAVCTHGDGDHAGGFTSLLDHWNGRIGQLWLPGRWAQILPELMLDPKPLVDALIDDLLATSRERPELNASDLDAEDIEKALDIDSVRESSPQVDDFYLNPGQEVAEVDSGRLDEFEEPGWMQELRSGAIEIIRRDPIAQRVFASARARVYYRMRRGVVGPGLGRYWLGLIETEEIIRKIASQAFRRSIKIRWFDYGGFTEGLAPRGGVPGLLVPINAVEQSPPPRILRSPEFLSKINRESLVFYAPENRRWPAILFTSDSPLGTGSAFTAPFPPPRLRPRRDIVATAPHHGAESNSMAYRNISTWANVAVWIRAGGSSRHPERTFRSLPVRSRACTNCPHLNVRLRPVDLHFHSYEAWHYLGGRPICSC